MFTTTWNGYRRTYLLMTKGETASKLKQYLAFIARLPKCAGKVRVFRTDNGGEFVSDKFVQACEDAGIEQQLSVPYTPFQNGSPSVPTEA